MTVAHQGECGEDYDNTDFDTEGDDQDEGDEEDQTNEIEDPKNDCNKECNKKFDPICLNGERLYSNKCIMEVMVCLVSLM